VEDVRTEAFVLRTRAYGESDVIAVLLTADHGKLSGIARGARRSKKRFAGPALEPFQRLMVRFARRPHADLAFLHECRIVRSHHAMAADLPAFAWASYLSELTEVMTPERDPCPELYGMFERTIAALAARACEPQEHSAELIAHRFIVGLLDWAGWAPDFEVCGICAAPITADLRPIVDPRGSGLMCARHEAESLGHDPDDRGFQPSRRVVDGALLEYIRGLRVTDASEANAELAAAATALLHRLIDLHIERPLRSRRFLTELCQH
jgi:DNA repair protein RecO (recombination protein O)